MSDPTHTASDFAAALDADDFLRAQKHLARYCLYHFRGTVYEGPDAIIDTYRAASEWGRESFDAIDYESSVEPLDDGRIAVTFIDRLSHAGEQHTHTCRQILHFNPHGSIVRIEHEDLPGERDAVDAFMTRHGISR